MVLENTLESPLDCKEFQPVHLKGLGVHWKDWCWNWNSNTLATSCGDLTHWKRPWCWEGLGAGGEGDDRGWDGWMASPTPWTWVWMECGNWWWTGRPGGVWFMGSQRVRPDWATELNWQCRRPSFDPWVEKIPWRRKWQPTPVLLPGKSHGLRSVVGYNPWGRKESDMTEWLNFLFLSWLFLCYNIIE